jgi:hypothetical protein
LSSTALYTHCIFFLQTLQINLSMPPKLMTHSLSTQYTVSTRQFDGLLQPTVLILEEATNFSNLDISIFTCLYTFLFYNILY